MAEDGRWRQTSEIYHAALLRPTPDRDTFVREACGDDEALRRDVESLLAIDGSAQHLMNSPAPLAAAERCRIFMFRWSGDNLVRIA